MSFIHEAKKAVGSALKSARSGEEKLASRRLILDALPRLEIASGTFAHGAALPTRSTVDGDGTPPPLSWGEPPESARSFAVLCEDPDAPFPQPFVHWIVYDIPAQIRSLDANLNRFREGKNSKSSLGFTPAAPPGGHGTHHYHFQVFAIDKDLTLSEGCGRSELVEAMAGHVVAWGEIVGTYERC